MKKTVTANTNVTENATEMPRPVGLDTPAQMSMAFTDGDFSLTLNLPDAFQDGTFNECRKRCKLIAQYGTDADKALVDAWFAYVLDLCSLNYWLTKSLPDNEKAQRAEMRDYEKLLKRRALWESLTPDFIRTAAETETSHDETQAAEPETVSEPEAAEPETNHDEPKAEMNKEETEMKKFEVGCMYWDTSAVDHECVMVIKITRRTEKNVWFVRMRNGKPDGEPRRTKIYTDTNAEYIVPERYSMAPVWKADRKVEPETAAVETAQENEPAAETETSHDETQAAEPETVSEPEAAEPETNHDEPKTEQAAKPEGRKPMNANFDFFAGCADEDTARKRYYQLSKVYHPDTGIGDTEIMQIITDQYQAFMGRSSVALDIPALPAGVIALPEHCETPAAVDEAAEYVDAIAAILKLRLPGVEAEICGKWVWVSGLNAEMKDAHAALKAAGYRFSGGKKMWYWVPSTEKGRKKHYRGTADMGYIRTKYGTRTIISNNELSA